MEDYLQVATFTATHVCMSQCFTHIGWSAMLKDENAELKLLLTKVQIRGSVPVMQFTMVINQDMSWSLFVFGVELSHHNIPGIELPSLLDSTSSISHLLQHLTSVSICQGNPDEKFHQLLPSRKGMFMNKESKLHNKRHIHSA